MKTFFAVLGAILTAGVIFWVGYGMVAHFSEWKNEKEAMIRTVQRNSAAYESAYSTVMKGLSAESTLAEMKAKVKSDESALAEMKAASADNREAYGLLKFVLENKPFFSLNSDEEKWLAKALSELGEENKRPTPPPPTMPEFVTLKLDAEVWNKHGGLVRIPAGTKLKLLSYEQHEITFRYNNETYSLPAAITDFKKY
jgi:hypothetical protein